MPNLNCCHLMGHLTRDPEQKTTQGGTSIVTFGLAVSRKWKDKEEVCFVDCTAFEKTGGLIHQYCHKGSPIYIQGRLRLEQWTSPEGQKRSKHSITVDQVQLLRGKSDDNEPHHQRSSEPTDRDYAQYDDKPGADVPF